MEKHVLSDFLGDEYNVALNSTRQSHYVLEGDFCEFGFGDVTE